MRHKLKWLAGIAIVALLCIIGLQVFWLRTSYKEQESRFMADAENVLISTQVKMNMSRLNRTPDTTAMGRMVAAMLPDLITEIVKKTSNIPDNVDMEHMNFQLSGNDSLVDIDSNLKVLAKRLGKDTARPLLVMSSRGMPQFRTPEKMDLSALKDEYLKELKKKGIAAQCEIAALDSLQRLTYATTDIAAFKNIPVKTDPIRALMDAPDVDHIQVAFPQISWYLLKRMVWILAISIGLILICFTSFSYLIAQFFRQKRLSEIRNDFMNNMTHELKTPISSVSVALELIDDAGNRGETSAVKEYIGIAQGELNRLTMLVEKVLKMAAFEKSDIKVVRESFLAAAWLQKINNSFKPIYETRGVICETEVSPELLMIYADKTHLTNVLQNLIDNAIKYNDKERPVIRISITARDNSTIITVSDNGNGIPEAYVKKIFDKFFRVPSGNVHNVKGYGLGLSYIKAITDLHGGSINVTSTVNEGSTFTITLPENGK